MKRIVLNLLAIHIVAFPLFSQIINIPSDFSTIQAGIDSASDGDTVLVAEGTYFENINLNGRAIVLASHYILDGDTSHISKTIIDGSQSSHPDTASAITLDSGEDTTTVITGFYITGGKGTLVESPFKPSSPYYGPHRAGGGIIIQDAGCKISNNQICGNVLSNNNDGQGLGAGIQVYFKKYPLDEAKQVVIQNNLISENEIFGKFIFGAGIAVEIDACSSGEEISLIIENNTISYNSLTGLGNHSSGISMGFVLPVRRGVYHFRGNHVHHNMNERDFQYSGSYYETGPVYVSYFSGLPDLKTHTQPWIYNNIIENNSGKDDCGGIEAYSFANLSAEQMEIGPVIMNNTILNNNVRSTTDGIGLRAQRTKPLVFNNIFWDALNHESQKEFKSVGGKILAYHNIVRNGWYGSNNRNFDPLLDSLTYEPISGSPCIGYGIKSIEKEGKIFETYPWDYYSNNRPDPIDDLVDIGAVETPYNGFVFIPDTAFLNGLIEDGVDTNEDSLINYREAEIVTRLFLGGRTTITDLTGIEAFKNLTELDIWGNMLTELNLSHNQELTELTLANMQLTELDLSHNQELTSLLLQHLQLTDLDLSSNQKLEALYCIRNDRLVSLEIANCSNLIALNCGYNRLSTLDVRNNTKLELIYCGGNLLTNLDLSQNIALGGNTWKQSLSIGVWGNMDNASLILDSMATLEQMCVSKTFNPDSVGVSTYLSPNIYFTSECESNIVEIPDTAFLHALIDEGVDTNGDSLISYEEAEKIISLDVSSPYDIQVPELTINDMTGIEAFISLDTLILNYNSVSSLDLSNNKELTYLRCSDNELNSLDLTLNSNLKFLMCVGNEIDRLDLSENKALEYLFCGGNPLTNLDLTNNPALKRLECDGNMLSNLDISNNSSLGHLLCMQNQLMELDISNNEALYYLVCSENLLTELDISKNPLLETLNCQDNPLTTLDLSKNPALVSLCCNNTELKALDISNNIKLTSILIMGIGTLHEVCVWESFSPDSVDVDIGMSPNVYFTTECTMGIEETILSGLKIYPNPTNRILTIETEISDNYSIGITSLNGQQVFSGERVGTTHKLDISSFQKGVYFITIRSENIIIIRKIIKL